LRPLLPEHDLNQPDTLLKPNTPQIIELAAMGGRTEKRGLGSPKREWVGG